MEQLITPHFCIRIIHSQAALKGKSSKSRDHIVRISRMDHCKTLNSLSYPGLSRKISGFSSYKWLVTGNFL